MRAAARELHHRRPPQAEGLIPVPVVDQFPAHAVAVQILDGRARRVGHHLAVATPDDPLHPGEVYSRQPALGGPFSPGAGLGESFDQVQRRRLALAAHYHVHLGMIGEDFLVVAGENAAVDGDDVGQGRLDGAQGPQAAGVGLGRADVGDHDDVGPEARDALGDLPVGKAECRGVDQGDCTAGIEEGPTHHEQAERHLVADAVVAHRRLERGVDQGNAEHGAVSGGWVRPAREPEGGNEDNREIAPRCRTITGTSVPSPAPPPPPRFLTPGTPSRRRLSSL